MLIQNVEYSKNSSMWKIIHHLQSIHNKFKRLSWIGWKKKWDRWSIKPDLFSLISVTRPRKIVFDKWASDRWRITTYMHQLINEHFFIYQILRPTNHNLIDHDNKTLRPIGLIMLDIRSCLLQWLIIIYRLL